MIKLLDLSGVRKLESHALPRGVDGLGNGDDQPGFEIFLDELSLGLFGEPPLVAVATEGLDEDDDSEDGESSKTPGTTPTNIVWG